MTTPHITPIQALFEDSNLELDLSKNADGHYLNEVARYAWMNWMTAYSFGREHRANILNKATEIALAEANAELKALYAQQVKEGTLGNYDWETLCLDGKTRDNINDCVGVFYEKCVYFCTPKEKLVKLIDFITQDQIDAIQKYTRSSITGLEFCNEAIKKANSEL